MRHITRAEEEQIVNSILGERLPNVGPQAPHTQSLAPHYKIGSRLNTPDGLTWHYCRCGANGVANAYRDRGMATMVVTTNPDDIATFLVAVAAGAGATQLIVADLDVTHGVNYWANGKVEIWANLAVPIGSTMQQRTIKSSTASDGATVTLTLYHPLTYAVAAGEGMEICPSIYGNVDQADAIVGPNRRSIACVPLMSPITALYYFWGLTWGRCTIAQSADMGLVDGQRQVTFNHADGTIRPSVLGEQIAGYLLPYTPAAETAIMLQLDA